MSGTPRRMIVRRNARVPTPVAASFERSDAGLRLDGVSVGPQRAPGLVGLSLAVPPGGAVALLGGPAAGKSLVIALLAGFARPSAGRVLWHGVDIAQVAAHRRGFGLLQQREALVEHWTVAANVGLPLRL